MLITPNMTIEDRVKAFRQWLDTKRESFTDTGSYDDANIINGIISIYDAVFDVCENKKDSHSDLLENYGTQLLFYLSNYIDAALLRLKEKKKNKMTREETYEDGNLLTPSTKWHDVTETPEEMQELLVEWDSADATWHEVAFYHADTKTFWDGERKVENVTRWCYIE